jgi:outer membrane protein TolC
MASLQQQRFFKVNFESEGFPANNPILNPVIGPFDAFDARLQLVQTLLDFNAIWKRQASVSGERIAKLEEGLAREQVATAAALAYLEAQRTQRAVSAAQADLDLSESLFKLARDQHAAGISTGIDVARAETERAQENLRLIRAQVAAHEADLRLKRVVGLPLDKPVSLPDLPRADLSELPSVEKALGQANHDRFELQITQESYQAATDNLRAAKAENLPSLKAMADYGYNGVTIDNNARTGSIGGRLDLPILAGGATHGRVVEYTALQKEAGERDLDARAQVEEDVRLSLQTLTAEIEETRTADQVVDLARKELKMAKDRFSAGVGDNIQVLNAQTALARALDDQVDSFARYDTARVNLAVALGRMQAFR